MWFSVKLLGFTFGIRKTITAFGMEEAMPGDKDLISMDPHTMLSLQIASDTHTHGSILHHPWLSGGLITRS